MKKRYAMTLLEIMIVIFIIGIITSVIGYNMRGSLDKGKAFKTKQGVNKLYEIVQLQDAQGDGLKKSDQEKDGKLADQVKNLLESSGLVRKSSELMKDGWGNLYEFDIVGGDLRATSKKYDEYCDKENIKDRYPWSDDTSQ
ncbi:prepilin-type N-terminal cleavage/methylation domain-containing protein [Candidatus Neptunochlamydia vexilliferae]|nr:prepilin-type N-terminal cleavage/methylation domain-containing protein [Candidatus Neptunochlamydia vexilliferae]